LLCCAAAIFARAFLAAALFLLFAGLSGGVVGARYTTLTEQVEKMCGENRL